MSMLLVSTDQMRHHCLEQKQGSSLKSDLGNWYYNPEDGVAVHRKAHLVQISRFPDVCHLKLIVSKSTSRKG